MGDSLTQWRSAIGCFNQLSSTKTSMGKGGTNTNPTKQSSILIYILKILAVNALLVYMPHAYLNFLYLILCMCLLMSCVVINILLLFMIIPYCIALRLYELNKSTVNPRLLLSILAVCSISLLFPGLSVSFFLPDINELQLLLSNDVHPNPGPDGTTK
ncbi:unnamed protein product, partial [Owenia fusiformis]